MGLEQIIRGSPHGNKHHDGRASNVRREQEADFELEDSQVIFDRGKPVPRNVFNRRRNRDIAKGRINGQYFEDGKPR